MSFDINGVERQLAMNLTQLIETAADPRVNPRFVRFLIAEGVIPAPSGGRTYATYGADHLHGIRRYLRLRDAGLSVAAIRLLAAGHVPAQLAVALAPGVTLTLRPDEIHDLPPAETLAERIIEACADLQLKLPAVPLHEKDA